MDIQDLQPGDTIGWYFTNGLTGQQDKAYGIVRSIGETYSGSGVMRVYVSRPGKLYRGLVIGVDPKDIFERKKRT